MKRIPSLSLAGKGSADRKAGTKTRRTGEPAAPSPGVFAGGRSFEIAEPLMGYRKDVARSFDPRYKQFKHTVRLVANCAGVPSDIPPRPGYARIHVEIFWRRRARIDGANIYKAVEDALFGEDRRVRIGSFAYHEDQGHESALVVVGIEAS